MSENLTLIECLAQLIECLDRIVFPGDWMLFWSATPVVRFKCTPEVMKKALEENRELKPCSDEALLMDVIFRFQSGEVNIVCYNPYPQCPVQVYVVYDYGDSITETVIQRRADELSLQTVAETLISITTHEVRHKVQERYLSLPEESRHADAEAIALLSIRSWRECRDLRKIAEIVIRKETA